MKRFYIVTNGQDFKQYSSVNSGSPAMSMTLKGNEIHYLDDEKVSLIQGTPLTEFGDSELNMLNKPISVVSIITTIPIAPADETWYLVSVLTTDPVLSEYKNHLFYFDSQATVQNKYLRAFNGLRITIDDGDTFEFNNNFSSDSRWKKVSFDITSTPVAPTTGSNDDVNILASQLTVSDIQCKTGVQIKADNDNTAAIYVGTSSNVTAGTDIATDGYRLVPGEPVIMTVTNANQIWVITTVNTQKAWFIAF